MKPPAKMEMTEHEIFLQRKLMDMQKRAQYHWALLRESVRSVKQAVEEADVKELEIAHGMYRERSLNHTQQITQVLFIPERREYLTCDGQTFYCFDEEGRNKSSFPVTENINRVVYSSQTNQFVGYVYGQEHLFLMTADFVVGTQSKAVGKILMAAYNKSTGELITVGPHFITFWMFRYGARYLIPRKTTTTDFGETNMFITMVLEEAIDQTQKIYFAYENGVVVYNIFEGTEVAHKKSLHSQPLTAMTFFNPYKYIITGSRDGCIKVWDADWKIKIVFVGHSAGVNFLQIYPYGPAFISASLDCTLRVWNMDTRDEIDKTVINEPIQGIDTQMDYDIFYTYSGNRVDLWKLQHLYYIHTHIGYKVSSIKVTSHPMYPQQAVVLCGDSSIHIVCPANGEVITTMLMKQSEGLVDAAYALAEGTIFAVMSNGDIVKGLTNKNPCDIVSRWKGSNSEAICNCLLVYEYLIDPSDSSDVFTLAKHVTQRNKAKIRRQKPSKNRTLLLGGRKDGYICLFDWLTGKVTFKAEAHGTKGVLNMVANTRSDQLISAGMDNVIQVWRVYPFAQEALTPLMSFYCAQCPSFMTTIKNSLGIAFQDLSTATFSVVLYSLADKSRFDHKPDDDHMDRITGLSSCPRMKLHASSSMDGTVRIWSENNTLIRLLRLNAAVHSIAFCSPQGDLLVGMDNHLFHIPHTKYLPKSYKRRQACMKFLPVKTEQPLPYDENKLTLMDKADVTRLKNSHASFRRSDILPFERHLAIRQDSVKKDKRFELLELRENELKQIRDGLLKAKHKPKPTKETQDTAFREYMKIYYNKEREKALLDDDYPEATLLKKLKEESTSLKKETTQIEKAPFGFFMELGQKLLENDPASPLHCGYPSTPTGFLPNSVLIKLLHPATLQNKELTELIPYKPPELTAKQLAEIQSLYKRQRTGQDFEDLDQALSRSVTYSDEDHLSRILEVEHMSDDEEMRKDKSSNDGFLTEKISEKKLDFIAPKTVQRAQTEKRQRKKTDLQTEDVSGDKQDFSEKSSLMSKFQEIIRKSSSKSKSKESEDIAPTAGPDSEATPHPLKSLAQTKTITPLKLVTKLISHPEAIIPTTASPKPSTPSVPSTQLPSFVRLFVTTEWFHKFFPNCNENTLPKPWTGDSFIIMICKLLRIADWSEKVNVIDAILYVYTEEGLSESVTVNVARTLVAVLNHHASPPVCSVTEQKVFILSSLKALATLAIKEKDMVVELMVQFLLGDTDIRSSVLDTMRNLGLADPHRQFQKELDTWDIWSIEEARLRHQLHNMCSEWLERWMISYKVRIQDSMNLLKQGHSLQGHIPNVKSFSGGFSRKLARSFDRETSASSQNTVKTCPPAFADVTSYRQHSSATDSSVTVRIDNFYGTSVLQSISYLDAVTYFCEMMTEKELELLKQGQTLQRKQQDGQGDFQNTVLVLPRISKKPALVRLGEMHTSQCRPERETCLHTDFHLPAITMRGRQPPPGDIGSFVSCINLPMKTVYLNPFSTNDEETDSHFTQPILITLKSSQKYFIPSLSYVPNEDYSLQRS